jgi:hypothetical protein
LGVQISPLGVGRFNQTKLRSARHLFDLAFAGNSLVDMVELFQVDQPVDVIASRKMAQVSSLLVFGNTPLQMVGDARLERSGEATHDVHPVNPAQTQ